MTSVDILKLPNIMQFFAMENVDILKLPVKNCQPSELYKGISYQIEHPVTNQILALKYFVNKRESSSERAELFDIVIPKLRTGLSELLQSPQLDELSSLISSVTLVICDTVDSTSGDSTEVLQSLAVGILDLLLQLYRLIYERSNRQPDDVIELESVVESVNAIQSKVFDFLVKNEANYVPDHLTSNDVTFMNRLIFILCEMVEFFSKAGDAKVWVAVWRCITTFCVGKLSKSIDRLPVNEENVNRFEFLLSAVKTGCFCIQYGVQQLREVTSVQIGKWHSKTIAFTTSVFQRLAANYSHDKFQGHDHILTTLLDLMRAIRSQSGANEFLNQSLASGLQNVLLSICRSDQFVKFFCQASCDEYSSELLHVGLELSKKLLSDDDTDFLKFFVKNENVNIVSKLLECVSTDPLLMFNRRRMRTETVETVSRILSKCSMVNSPVNPNAVPRLLVKNLLQCDDIFMGYILIDLWSAWIRCLSQEQRSNLFLFWCEINERCSNVQPRHLSSVHVKILLRHLYDSLSGADKHRVSSDKRIFGNSRLVAALGRQRIKCDEMELTELHLRIGESLKAFSSERSDSTFYKLIEQLRLLETICQPNATTTPVPAFLIELWNLNLSNRPHKYSPLIIPLIRISIAHQRGLNNGQHVHILWKLTAIVSSPNATALIKLEVLQYLRHIAVKYFTVEHQKAILELIQRLFGKCFIDADPVVRNASFIAYARTMDGIQHDDIQPHNITDDEDVKMELLGFIRGQTHSPKLTADEKMKFFVELRSYSIEHECSGSVSSDGVKSNGTVANAIRMKEIIEQMRSDTSELMELNHTLRLKEEFFENIASIRRDLATLK